jgi:hypothetical protein
VTTIGDSAFHRCMALTSVTIPASVTAIGNYAFYNCDNLAAVYVNAAVPPTLGGTYVFDNNPAGRMIYVPAASVSAYQSATYWSNYAGSIASQ